MKFPMMLYRKTHAGNISLCRFDSEADMMELAQSERDSLPIDADAAESFESLIDDYRGHVAIDCVHDWISLAWRHDFESIHNAYMCGFLSTLPIPYEHDLATLSASVTRSADGNMYDCDEKVPWTPEKPCSNEIAEMLIEQIESFGDEEIASGVTAELVIAYGTEIGDDGGISFVNAVIHTDGEFDDASAVTDAALLELCMRHQPCAIIRVHAVKINA